MEVLNRRAQFFYNELSRISNNENKAKNTRRPSIANTYKNEPEFQQAQNLSRNYARIGQQKFGDPFQVQSRPYDDYYNGRKLQILESLMINSKKDKADVITANPLKVVGYY